jgi:hypothetical protein
MLHLCSKKNFHSFEVIARESGDCMHVTLAADEAHGEHVPVTEVYGRSEVACRALDACTRTAFTALQPVPGQVHILQAPAGSGKTTCNIDLAKQQSTPTLLLAFNAAAIADGKLRTSGNPSVVWQTIDSMVWKLYSPTEAKTELDDLPSFSSTVFNMLTPTAPGEDEIESMQADLIQAFRTASSDALTGPALVLYNTALEGKWWCFESLRVRALHDERWPGLFEQFPLICVDEAQDLALVLFLLMKRLHTEHCFVYTLDANQKIYSFMRCINIQTELDYASVPYTLWQLYLTFRHGQSVCNLVSADKDTAIFSSLTAPITEVVHMQDEDVWGESHTFIVSSWRNALLVADKLMNAGITVCFPEEKQKELKKAAEATTWTKHDATLFRHTNKAFVADVMSRVQDDGDVFISTVHGAKGLQWPAVRVGRCVYDIKGSKQGKDSDSEAKRYVAMTRAMHRLMLPAPKTLKRARKH